MHILKPLRPLKQVFQPLGMALLLLVAACAAPDRQVTPPPPPVAVSPEKPPEVRQNRVALLVPLSGPNAPVGQSIANAASLALLDLGASQINLRVYDTAPGPAAAASRALAEGAGLILGPLLAGDVRAVDAVVGAVPVLSFSNDASLAGGNVFILGYQPDQSISRVVAYARSRGVERFAALVPAGVYGQRVQTAFVRAVEASGGQTTALQTYTREPSRMGAAVREVTAFDTRSRSGAAGATVRRDGSVATATSATRLPPPPFQALLIADSGSNAAQFLPALSRFGVPPGSVTLLGTELWNNEPGLANAAALRGALFATVSDRNFRTLANRYKAKHGSSPSRLASVGYDAVLLVNSLAGSWALGEAFPMTALRSRQGFSGIDGAFRFDASNVALRALEVEQIGAGQFNTVSPAPGGF